MRGAGCTPHFSTTRIQSSPVPYPELHAASAFSFLDGASLPEALVARAAELGYPALALLDRDGVYGAPRFHIAARKAGIRAVIGPHLGVPTLVPRPHLRAQNHGPPTVDRPPLLDP